MSTKKKDKEKYYVPALDKIYTSKSYAQTKANERDTEKTLVPTIKNSKIIDTNFLKNKNIIKVPIKNKK